MRQDRTKALLSIMATLTSGVLVLVYWLAPADAGSHRLHVLLIDCIPDAVIVLLAMPIVYWLFYRRGLTNMGDCPLFSAGDAATLANRSPHPCQKFFQGIREKHGLASGPDEPSGGERDVLLVVEAANGVVAGAMDSHDIGKTVEALDRAIRAAERREMPVVFAREGHRPRPRSKAEQGGASDCPNRSSFQIHRPLGSSVFDLDLSAGMHARSALENPALDLAVSNPRVRVVYVAGMAEEAVQATCRAILENGKLAVALATTIPNRLDSPERTERVWRELAAEGLVRIERLPDLDGRCIVP